MECVLILSLINVLYRMPLTKSRENLLALEEPANCSFTIPIEESSAPPVTSQGRSKGRSQRTGNRSANLSDENHQQVQEIVSNSLSTFRGEMTDFIRNELRSLVRDMNLGGEAHVSQPGMQNVSNDQNNQNRNGNSPQSTPRTNSQEPVVGEKVSNIIRNWRIKFSGYDDTKTVDEFIYRINVLTTNNLNGDFDWFTRALRKQYKSEYNDYDVMENIHRRKQRIGEKFDDFFDSISALSDRLKTPLNDANLCAILLRNLRNEVRHELIHLDISSVSQLRLEVKRHEKFMKDVHDSETRRPVKAKVAEVSIPDINVKESDSDFEAIEICAVRENIRCWNCKKVGHTYFDRLEVRRIFCYGCGAKDIYRPTCPKCSSKPQGNLQRDVRRN